MKLKCRECEHHDEPEVQGKSLSCKKCKHPFGYFDCTSYFNQKNKERVAKERAQANASITRGLKK